MYYNCAIRLICMVWTRDRNSASAGVAPFVCVSPRGIRTGTIHRRHAVTCASRGSAVSSRSTPIAVVTAAHTATTSLYEGVSGVPFLQLQHLSFPSAVMSSRSNIAEEHPPCRSTMSLSTRFGLLCRRIWTSMRSGYVPRCIFQQPA